ncbi:MAG: hypothetical protein ABIH11_03505 [Candidatus Altiarchaeota archaeon]
MKGKKAGRKKSKNTRIWILAIGGIMILSALSFFSYSNQPANPTGGTGIEAPILRYSVVPVGAGEEVASITGLVNQIVLLPNNQADVTTDLVEQVSAMNSTDITDTMVELTNEYILMRFDVNDRKNAEKEIRGSVNMAGGYTIYDVYKGELSSVEMQVIGSGLQVGDQVNVLAFQSADSQGMVIGFVISKNL